MRQMMLVVFAVAAISAGVATLVTIVLTRSGDPIAISSPAPTTTMDAPTTSPDETEPTAAPSAIATPDADDEPASTPFRSASSVDCEREPKFCSSTDSTVVTNDTYSSLMVEEAETDYDGVPTITMRSEVWEGDNSEAEAGDKVDSIHVQVVVENKTDDTFVFAKREIVLVVKRNGSVIETLRTTGEGFEMTPDGRMTGTFDRPITADGTYSWQAKTWYYEK